MSLKLQEEYGDDLQVVFVEVQGASDEKVASFALGQRWLGGKAMWTTERPFDLGLKGIPQFALISPQGDIVLSGYSNKLSSKIEDEIESMTKAKYRAPKDMPKDVGKAWVESNKGNYAKALDMAEKALADAKDDDAKAEAAKNLIESINARIEGKLKRIDWLLNNGFPIDAQDLIDEMSKGVKGLAEREKKLEELEEKLDTPEMKVEIEAQKALVKIEKKLYESPDIKYVKSLKKIVDKYPNTKTAERASQLAKVAAI